MSSSTSFTSNEQQPRLAARFKLAVRAAFRAIESSPLSGVTFQVATIPDVVFRFRKPRGFKNYLVIYQVTDDTVFVLRVLHSSQNLETELRP